ncbi:MAG: beta-agarase, partial [Planctomycetota bacterium]
MFAKDSVICLLFVFTIAFNSTNAQERLFEFVDCSELEMIQANSVKLSIDATGENGKLIVESGSDVDWPGIEFTPVDELWDAAEFQKLSFKVKNTGEHAFEIGLRIDNPGGEESEQNRMTVMSYVEPGRTQNVTAAMNLTPWRFSKPLNLVGMHAAPGQFEIDPSKICKVIIFVRQPSHEHQFEISELQFHGPMEEIEADGFLPFIDKYGQYIHAEWPGKTQSDLDFTQQKNLEATDLDQHPGPLDFNSFGGSTRLPRLAPSSHFRVEKVTGQW